MGPAVICVQKEDFDTLKCMIITQQNEIRTWITSEESKNTIKSIKAKYPIFDKIKFQKVKKQQIKNDLADFERTELQDYNCYKFGVIYVNDQQSENEIFSNRDGSKDWEEFLDYIGEKVKLKGFTMYSGGLDTKRDSYGTHSIYEKHKSFEIMFHVSTLLKFDDENCINIKKHIGNDIVLIIFKDGNFPFDTSIINSKFNHSYVIIEKIKNNERHTSYNMVVATKPGIKTSTPILPNPPIFRKNLAFKDFLLTKCINLERVALNSPALNKIKTVNRKAHLLNIAEKYYSV